MVLEGLYEKDAKVVTQMMKNMKLKKNFIINNDDPDVVVSDDSDFVVSDDSDDECVIQMQNIKLNNNDDPDVVVSDDSDFVVSDDSDFVVSDDSDDECVIQMQNIKLNNKDESILILEHLNEIIKTLGDKIKENLDLLIGWKQEVQLYCVLKIYTTLGVPPTSELIQIQITPYTSSIGSYTIKDKKMLGSYTIKDKKLLGILRLGIGHYLISDSKGLPFQDSDSFIDFMTHFCGYSPEVLRDILGHNSRNGK